MKMKALTKALEKKMEEAEQIAREIGENEGRRNLTIVKGRAGYVRNGDVEMGEVT